jgi:MoxR-like ATPase
MGETQTAAAGAATFAAERVRDFARHMHGVRERLQQLVATRDRTIDTWRTCRPARSRALLVGTPGLAKALTVKALAIVFHWKFARTRSTPDQMASCFVDCEVPGRRGEG